ncbi:NAD(P)/FAD-dependent oxidoreductase [Petrocella sp. FN5]|uniref:NAD(P)/FAD-dependent oxidoreductase n=1 Tax=Petrocella sp. FN5 TaxID=3032002 RepID=UPI0023D98415|nr:NAD(P)/FAD-dependent oxidoreductase [Petrocella sp. FN5]MDF1617532.1 NAD(P)/FAD-dependent oxidoreductase [Petrocella sp. FN5]
MKKVIIIGGGPAGMVAAIMAAREGHDVTLMEQNEKLGKKLYITGKGRCNLTNEVNVEALIKQVVTNPKFLYSSFYTFDSEGVVRFFNEIGLETKVERGNRVFPQSDKSSDVINALMNAMKALKVDVRLKSKVTGIAIEKRCVKGVYLGDLFVEADDVIVATGGISYQMTGATGDGYLFAKDAGHKVIRQEQGLVPLNIVEDWVKALQGLSLKNVELVLKTKDKVLYRGFGEMLFTHFGISGPLVLTGSSYLKDLPYPIQAFIDLKPKLSIEQMDLRLLKDFELYNRKNFENALADLLPKKLIPIVVLLSGIDPEKKVDQITKVERLKLLETLKALPMTVNGKRGYNEAIITQGGVDVKEINPNTMGSRIVDHLYFVGEVLDLDALTGGFNLQIAFSTAYLAGISIDKS